MLHAQADPIHGFCGTDCSGHHPLPRRAAPGDRWALEAPAVADRGVPGPCTEDGSQIDILIVYTPSALAGAGSLGAMQTLADDAIAELNGVLASSGLATTAVLAGLEETMFNESGSSSTHLKNLRDPEDGVMDEVHALRDTLRADLVCLFVENGSVCGIANIAVQAGYTPRPDLGLSVVDRNCLGTSLYTFSHEIGHNLGLLHDRDADPCELTGADPAAHGYTAPMDAFQTVMSTNGVAPREAIYSSPLIDVGGVPAGVAGLSNNALVASQSVVAVSRFRDRDQDSDGVCDADQIAMDPSLDCNLNGVLDQFDIDFNRNGVPDDCDIASATSMDVDLDGVPDEAEVAILRVDADAGPLGDGQTWGGAIDDLQFAMALARASGDVDEMWIAEGVYTPGQFRAQTFDLVGGVALYGGFDGTEPAREDRDPDAHEVVLSGDLNADDAGGFIDREDNSVTVVYGFEETGLCTLDGLTIAGGHSVEAASCVAAGGTSDGGGLFALFCDLEINDCVFRENAALRGGGVFLPNVSSWRITETDIINNRAFGPWTSASSAGAYLTATQLPGEMTDCRVLGNVSDGGTAGVFFIGGTPIVNNVLFSGNRAIQGAYAAMYARLTTAGSVFNNLTIVENQTDGNFAVGGANFDSTAQGTLSNSILWGNKIRAVSGPVTVNQASQIQVAGALTIDSCLVEGWTGSIPGTATSGDNPLMSDVLGPDAVPGTLDDDPRPAPGSPAIDSGNNTLVGAGVSSDLDGNERFVDDPDTIDLGVGSAPIVDRGAYELQVPAVFCNGDANGDLVVNFADVTTVLGNWNADYLPGTGPGDANGDSIVNFADVTSILASWNSVCP